MERTEPIIVVFGPWCGGTSAVAGVLRQLGVFMGAEFDWSWREPHETWEDSRMGQLCRRAFTEPGAQPQLDAGAFATKLRQWANDHRAAARAAGRPPGVKHPLLCVAIEALRAACGPIVPVVVERPFDDVVRSLNRLGWWDDEQQRAESTAHLIEARDRALGDVATVRVDFNALRANPGVVIRGLASELGLNVTENQVDRAVESILQPADLGDADPYGLDLLLARVKRNPDDQRSVYFLAQTYDFLQDFADARRWYTRWLEMGAATGEEAYQAMYRIAVSMDRGGEPWPGVQAAYLRAWEFRSTRAEPLHAIAVRYRVGGRYRLGHLFAGWAAAIPFPADDMLFESPDVYTWRAVAEQAVCAYWIGEPVEAFTLSRRLLARPDVPDDERQRIAANRDFSVPAMLEAASSHPRAVVGGLAPGAPRARDAEVTVSVVAGPGPGVTELTLNSFLHCCTDIARVGRFLVEDTGLSAADRTLLGERFGFVEFIDSSVPVRERIGGRFWLRLGQGWRFFAPERYITRLTAVLHAEPQVFQVGINYRDAVGLTGACAAEEAVRRTPDAGRYVLSETVTAGPAMVDIARLDRVGGTATLDEVLCIR